MQIREWPIAMDAESVRAILDGRKVQARRVILPQPDAEGDIYPGANHGEAIHISSFEGMKRCPYGQSGDRLWIREEWAFHSRRGYAWGDPAGVCYRATHDSDIAPEYDYWRPAHRMRQWASRITLRNTYVGIEQLQEITKADALAEGIDWTPGQRSDPVIDFIARWDSINAKHGYSYAANPWVWLIEFERIVP